MYFSLSYYRKAAQLVPMEVGTVVESRIRKSIKSRRRALRAGRVQVPR